MASGNCSVEVGSPQSTGGNTEWTQQDSSLESHRSLAFLPQCLSLSTCNTSPWSSFHTLSAAANSEKAAALFRSPHAGNPMNHLWCEPFFPPSFFELISRYLSVQLGALLKTDFINHNLQTLRGEKKRTQSECSTQFSSPQRNSLSVTLGRRKK